MFSPRRLRCFPVRSVVLAAVLLAVAAPAAPALAHAADPRISTVVAQISPPLPREVVVQVQAGIATQLVAANPTATVLEVLGETGRAFLQLSVQGVFADLETEEFFTTSNPTGAAPPGTGKGGPARWVQISTGSSWGWYDHRLHPRQVDAPADPGRPARLGEFEVPVRYGEVRSVVRGEVLFSPRLGGFQVSADPAPAGLPAGLVVQALSGQLPGIFLSNPARLPLTVFGRDGEPFLRFGPAGLEVNENSRTHVEDRQARGQPAGPPRPQPAFRLVDSAGTSYTWLDARLRYPADLPPEAVLRAAQSSVVDRWAVPIELATGRAALTGQVTWVPEATAAAARSRTPESDRLPLVPLGLAAAALVALAVFVIARRRS